MATVSNTFQTGNHAGRPTSGLAYGALYACSTHGLIYQTSDGGGSWATWYPPTAAITGTKIDDLTAGDDNTDLNTSTTKHGLAPKLDNNVAHFLNGQGGWTTPAGGSVATDTIFDAKGDLPAGTGADTAAKLTVGANDTILMADSGQSTGLKWVASQTPSTQAFGDAAAEGTADTYARGDHKHAMPASPSAGTLIGLQVYAPSSLTVLSTSSSTLADVDATNAAVTFTAPASGNVLIRASAWTDNTGGDGDGFIGLRESTSNIATSVTRVHRSNTDSDLQYYTSVPLYVTGLSAGSHTLKLSYAITGGTFRIIVQDGSVATTKWGPLIMEVWAAP